jgi:GNAT superfamily N-acetyltransferase
MATVEGEPAAFTAIIHFPHPYVKNIKRYHRTVVLPDYQGIGIATVLRNYVSKIIKENGFRLYTTTSHPALIAILKKDNHWVCRRKSRVSNTQKKGLLSKTASVNRITTSWEYI